MERPAGAVREEDGYSIVIQSARAVAALRRTGKPRSTTSKVPGSVYGELRSPTGIGVVPDTAGMDSLDGEGRV